MALQMSFAIGQTGIVVPEAYFRVDDVLIVAGTRQAFVSLSVYKDRATRDSASGRPLPDQFLPEHGRSVRVSQADFDTYFADARFEAGRTNPRRQAYLWLSTLPDFQTAVNV